MFVSRGWPVVSFLAFTLTYLAIIATMVLTDRNKKDNTLLAEAGSCLAENEITITMYSEM
jgi:hypothetical protein